MATPWPQVAAWPNDPREHAAYLSDYLRKALVCIDSAEDQSVPKPLVKTMIAAMSVLITKFQNTPDLSAVIQAVTTIQSDLKTTAETVQSTAIKVEQNTITHQQVAALSQETNRAVKEAAETRRITTELLQETNDIAKAINDTATATNDIVKVAQSTPPSKASYASVLTSNAAPLSKPITLSTQTSSFVQAQREIIVKITDPATIASLRAKSPRNLQNHIDRAIEQSRNEHIERIRVASANQLKSGDLSIKTSNRDEAEALKQFANDWITRIGKGTSIRLPTYGILAHGIRTSSMDVEKFDEIKAELLYDNRPFIPNADIKYIGWLSRAALTKSASTIIVEFTTPEDANKVIDEGLIWQGEAFRCERYDRQCRLKQCYKCQKYGHIGTQCKANTACGYCAEPHSSKDCPTKVDKSAIRKCAVCKGVHEAWNNRCPVRKVELSKVKAAYDARQPYHFVPPTKERLTMGRAIIDATPAEAAAMINTTQRGRPSTTTARPLSLTPTLPPSRQNPRSKSPTKGRAPKRVHLGNGLDSTQDENEDTIMVEDSQRPQRRHIPSRRALESITTNSLISS
jgi:dGTP triphosphohydrolase